MSTHDPAAASVDTGSGPAKPIVSVPVADLLRVLPFKAGDDDVRYYLNGVLITPYEDHALLVATNGHWMAVYESAESRTDKDRILDLPVWFANQLSQLSDFKVPDDDDDDEGFEEVLAPASGLTKTLTVASESSHLTVSDADVELLLKPGLPFIDGKFPNWRKPLPDPSALERGLFAPFAAHYLSRLHDAVPQEYEHPLFCYQQKDGTGPGIFRFGNLPQLVIALMPRRDAHLEVKDWPAWMAKTEVAA